MISKRVKTEDEGYTNLVPMVLGVIIAFAVIGVGIFIIGMLGNQAQKMLPRPATHKDQPNYLNTTFNRLNNTSRNFDSVLSVVNIAIIIAVLAMAIGSIFLFTRVGGA